MFSDLPDGCVANVVELLHSVRDVLNFQATCTRHANIVKAQQTKWLQMLRTDFDIRLQVQRHLFNTNRSMQIPTVITASTVQASAQIDGQELYRSVAVSKPRTLRYHGCFTDGGVDEQLAAYWASPIRTLCCAVLSGLTMTCCCHAGGQHVHPKPLGKLLQPLQ